MNSAIATPGRSRAVVIILWVVKIVLALLFTAAAVFKLTGQPMMVAEFDKIGLGQGFRYVAALVELASAVLIIIPRTAFFGALGLVGICVGAFIAQIGPLHGDVIHTIVLGALAATVAWFSRPAR